MCIVPVTILPVVILPISSASAMQAEAVRSFQSSTEIIFAVVSVVVGVLLLAVWTVWRMFQRYRQLAEDLPHMDIARARLAAIVESSEDAIIGKNDRGIVTSWNRSAERIFGYTATEMIGKDIRRLLPAGHEQEEGEILERIKRGETVDHFETVRQRKDGQLIEVSVTISPIRDASGRVVRASKIAREINEKKQIQRQLHQSQKMEAIGQLTGGIAHDFNNLLAVIMGNLELLEPLLAGNEIALRRVEVAQKAARRGSDLTRRLLAFSRQSELRPAVTSLEQSVQNMIDLAGRVLGPEISIMTSFVGDVPPVFVDPAGLESALLNLAVNARDAMPRGGSLTVSTYLRQLAENDRRVHADGLKAGTYACISLSDTGAGMSPETLERAFEPFFTTKPLGKGTGLGLAMVYGFVKQSGGAIRINSEVGYGTTVLIYLPLAGDAAPSFLATERSSPSGRVGGTVLVVDDEVDLLEVVHAYLAELGYAALTAKDGAEALEVLARHPQVDVLVTDIIMPGGLNGVSLAQMVRELRPQTRVIYSSGFTAEALAERDLALVEGPLLRKPFRRTEFGAAVRQAIGEANGEAPPLIPERDRRLHDR